VYRREKVDQALERGKHVTYNPHAPQFVSIDPGYSVRASMLCIQEVAGDRIEMWAEHSFTQMIDDDIASFVARHCLNHNVKVVYYDSEDPGLGAAIEKACAAIGATDFVVGISFKVFKRQAIKTTRWLLQHGLIAWQGETTTVHTPARVQDVPSIFRREVRNLKLKEGTDDEVDKGDDHGPDAWLPYVTRWIEAWAKANPGEI
jgi:hypothetical protein